MTLRPVLLATAALLAAGPLAAAEPPAPADPAATNRKASTEYDAGLRTNPAFRSNREHMECDAIESLDLRAQCIASFDEPLPKPKPAATPPLDPQRPTVTITTKPVRSPGDE